MSARVYVLLDVMQGELAEVAQTLRGRPGVAMVDVVEGPPNIIMVVEARGRRRLADLTVEALSSIESVTENLQLLPVTANRGRHGDIPTVDGTREQGVKFRRERTRKGTREDRTALATISLGNYERGKKEKTSGDPMQRTQRRG